MTEGRRRDPLIDADAFLCLRSLGILDVLKQSDGFTAILTQYIARHDLNDLRDDLAELLAAGRITIEAVQSRDDTFRRLRREGMHRGEAEAVAWALSRPKSTRPVFVSNDRDARRRATAAGVVAVDVLDLVVELLSRKLLTEVQARQKLATWDDLRQQQCRPNDWSGFDRTVAARRTTNSPW